MPTTTPRFALPSLALAVLLAAIAPPRGAYAQSAAATQPTAAIEPAETTAPVLVTLPPPGAAAETVAAPVEAAVTASPSEPIIFVPGSPCGTPSIVVHQSVVVNTAPPVSPPAVVAEAHAEPEDPPFEPAFALELGGFGDLVDFGGIGFTFDMPEGVPAVVRDLRIDLASSGDPRATLGGLSLAFSGRPQPWLRGPELRFSFGVGSFEGRTLAPAGAPNDVTLSLGDVFAFRLEGAFGVQHSFGPVSLFALGRIGWGAYFVSAQTHEARLGDLGEETLSAHRAELGTTVGASLLLGGVVHLEAAWRRTFTGATGDGFLVGLSAEIPTAE